MTPNWLAGVLMLVAYACGCITMYCAMKTREAERDREEAERLERRKRYGS